MIKEEELFNKIKDVSNKMKSLDDEHNKLEEEYFYLKQELDSLDEEQICDCDNCACSDECDGEFDDMVTVAETEINDLGIWITEEEDGERFVMLTDLIDGERVELSEAELNVIVAMMGL